MQNLLKYRSLFLCFLIFVFSFAVALKTFADELQITLLKAKPAVVFIECSVQAEVRGPEGAWQGDVGSGWGSGFIINPDGYIVTNGHVVANAHESNEDWITLQARVNYILNVVIPTFEKENNIVFDENQKRDYLNQVFPKYKDVTVVLKRDISVVLSNGRVFPAEVKQYSPAISEKPGELIQSIANVSIKQKTGKDVSILKIEARNLPTVELGDSDAVSIGETVRVIGFPSAAMGSIISRESKLVEQTISTGTITAGKRDVKGTAVIQTDASASKGNSGGPCINTRGQVIGILSYGYGDAGTFNWLVPINTGKEFIRAGGLSTTQQSLFDIEWEKALRSFVAGKFGEAEEAAKNVLIYMPDQPDATRLLLRIKESLMAQDKQPVQSTSLSTIIVVAGLFGVAILVVLFLVFGKKKPTTVKAQPVSNKTVLSSKSEKMQTAGVLIGRSGDLKGKSFPITLTGLKMGRDPSQNDIVIQHDEASREHAWIGQEGGRIVLKDLNSTNGTYINAVASGPVQKVNVNPGDIIIIGKGGHFSFIYQKG